MSVANRRTFLARCAVAAAGVCAVDAPGFARRAESEDVFDFERPGSTDGVSDVKAAHWEGMPDGRVTCRLCPRECRVAAQERGYCGVRANDGGVYKTLVYGRVCSAHIDPIEKKPFFHVTPGAQAFSIATAGCNVQCRFCQNWEISQFRPEQVSSVEAAPAQVVASAQRAHTRWIAYTYSEPVVFYEYVMDVARAGRDAGLRSAMVSNGYIQEKPLREILPHLDAVKIDLKGFTEDYYRDVCDGKLAPVLRTLEILRETGTWTEIVVLVIPTLNDDAGSMRALCDWISEKIGPETPVHFTRFHPSYRLQNIPSTPVATLERIHGYARSAGLRYAYLGNVPGHPAESTYCPNCSRVLVRRTSYTILDVAIKDDRCPDCGRVIPGIWS